MTQDEYADIDLAALSDDELTEQMHNDLYDGMAAEIVEGTNILLGRGWSATRVLDDALVAGMKIVGIDFRDGILFVPEVLLAANAMKAGMAILRPLLAETGAEPVGKVVIGTVKGDIHDIGKNLVGMMLEGAGFEVVDLGINTDADKFIAALELHKPDILGMSALLTTTMPYMKVVIQTLKDRGIREDYIVLVGGAPLNEEFGAAVGADAYCRDAGRGRRDRSPAHRRAPRQCGLTRPSSDHRPRPRVRRATQPPRVLVIGCGALARELLALTRDLPGVKVDVRRRRPAHAPGPDRRRRRGAHPQGPRASTARTRGSSSPTPTAARAASLDEVLGRRRAWSASAAPTASSSTPAPRPTPRSRTTEPGTFYLTDFLARQFETLDHRGPRPGPAPRAARRLLRELHPPHLPRPVGRPGR